VLVGYRLHENSAAFLGQITLKTIHSCIDINQLRRKTGGDSPANITSGDCQKVAGASLIGSVSDALAGVFLAEHRRRRRFPG
jgi:hypothetical protein